VGEYFSLKKLGS